MNKAKLTFRPLFSPFSMEKVTVFTQKMETAQSVGVLGLQVLWFGDKMGPAQEDQQHLQCPVLGENKNGREGLVFQQS